MKREKAQTAFRKTRTLKWQQGLSLPSAIFVITVMAFIAVATNSLVQSGAESVGQQATYVRAFYAAEAGVQLGLNRVFPPDGSASTCPVAASEVEDFSVDGLQGCSVSVVCSMVEVDVSGGPAMEQIYALTSTGTCGPSVRTIQVRAQ